MTYDDWKTRTPEDEWHHWNPGAVDPDEPEEPTGSCDECGVNVYDGALLCDSCEWKRAVAAGEVKL